MRFGVLSKVFRTYFVLSRLENTILVLLFQYKCVGSCELNRFTNTSQFYFWCFFSTPSSLVLHSFCNFSGLLLCGFHLCCVLFPVGVSILSPSSCSLCAVCLVLTISIILPLLHATLPLLLITLHLFLFDELR